MLIQFTDTIVAIATPPGKGGVGIIRISGPNTTVIATTLLKVLPKPRLATHKNFYDVDNTIIDKGIALYFPTPNSYTGEDVLELQGHGGPVVLDNIIQIVLQLGARLARPGEFSERAFLNGKMDLAQAEAVADLIDSGSKQAARAAMRSLQGEFSRRINQLLESIIHLRIYVEATLDFSEEEIDFLAESKLAEDLSATITELETILAVAKQGALLREGMTVVIAGPPNAGKSSLLNCLSGQDAAIVTDIPGTTRDVLREYIHIDGMPLHIIDTAGLRTSEDVIEQEGIRRSWREIEKADHILLVVDSQTYSPTMPINLDMLSALFSDSEDLSRLIKEKPLTLVHNKIDLLKDYSPTENISAYTSIKLSAKTGEGIERLHQHLKALMGYETTFETGFIARRRHLDALNRAKANLLAGQTQLQAQAGGELLAEELRLAAAALAEITGEFTTEDLLGRIFSSFCVGK
ncbi:tRNA uridine-5-carboxymethylaminomethyl(34) synthesis GTPase MnmE [soil metagenome]